MKTLIKLSIVFLTVLLITTSCGSSEKGDIKKEETKEEKVSSKEKGEAVKKDSKSRKKDDTIAILRKKDIELVKTYMKNSKKNLTDKNGFTINYEYEIKWGRKKSLAMTDTIANQGEYRNAMFLKLYIAELFIHLKLNGEQTKKVKFISHIYDFNELNPLLSSRIPKNYRNEKFIYTPDLDEISVQRKIIKKVTKPNFYQSGLIQNDNDKRLSNDWINVTSKLIKDSNILQLDELHKAEEILTHNN